MALQNKSIKPEQEKPALEPAEATVEKVEAVEVSPEAITEKAPEKVIPEKEKPAPAAPTVAAPAPRPAEQIVEKSEELVEVEKILSEGIEDLYKELPENRKQEFREKGEETARTVEKLLKAAKVQINKIVRLIVDWLKMIPGVNKFFLEQEAKIKSDKLLELKKEKEGTWEAK
ncbi:hypothetical protein HZB94_04385 [Candidatus Falkowbacteria bacterium]|nr:hypothetical protein [Candidatus Falkowbacteria bacterium]